MRDSYRVVTDAFKQADFAVYRRGEFRTAEDSVIMMNTAAAELCRLAVQKEPVFRVKRNRAYTEGYLRSVLNLTVRPYLGTERVQIRCVTAPQLWIFYIKAYIAAVFTRLCAKLNALFRNAYAVCVKSLNC